MGISARTPNIEYWMMELTVWQSQAARLMLPPNGLTELGGLWMGKGAKEGRCVRGRVVSVTASVAGSN